MTGPQTGKFRPWLHIIIFGLLVVLLYALVFFTPGSNSPKLGIDLQGGTRLTLAAKTLDGSDPTRESMTQARTIMETRVNGSGVVGAQVQIDGASQLVVTVPGKQVDLGRLATPARMNIRPQIGQAIPAVPSNPAAPTGTQGSGVSVSGTAPTSGSESPSSSAPISTRGPVGETQSAAPPPVTTDSPSTVAPSAADSSAAADSSGVDTAAASTATETTGTTSPAGDGLRAGAAAVSTPAASTSDDASPSEAAAPSSSPVAGSSSAAPGSDALPSVSGSGAPAADAGPIWPEGSNPENPLQPLSPDPTTWQAWETAAATAAANLKCSDLAKFQGNDDANKPLLACDEDGALIYVLDKTLIPGDQIAGANGGQASQGGPAVFVSFNATGFATWSAYTAANIGKQTAFTLDGQVLSSPSINGAINTVQTEVSGSFTQDETRSLANALKFGALPLNFTQLEKSDISAEVGAESLTAGLIAGGIGLLLVVLYCLIYYRLLGVITVLSLLLSGALVYAFMVLLGRWMDLSLDMAGIAGLIIAIGITADSFVVYFERIKDEVREGRTFRSAVPRGWERAKRTILSADAVTFLSAVILYVLAVGDVKGFAFTLGLSTVLDLVVVFLVTHPLVSLAADSPAFRSPTLSGLGAVAAAGARHRAATTRLAPKEA